MLNALTIDVEEYFHPTEVQKTTGLETWKDLPSRIEDQVLRILELLDSKNTKATFFILGWVAEHRPAAVRAIQTAGHQIACHSYAHQLVYSLTPQEFREDTRRAVAAIQDACGVSPEAYRAPSYSITARSMWAIEILIEEGFKQDSSIYPISHDRYGIPGFKRHAHVIQTASGSIQEIPIATAMLAKGRTAPIGGGAYLRLFPYRYTAAGIRRVNFEEGEQACIYFHPWEIDTHQPRIASGVISRIRTYTGMKGMHHKLTRLLTDFRFATLAECFGSAELRHYTPDFNDKPVRARAMTAGCSRGTVSLAETNR
jgi:polysaccharide deacetylase family protein (PEP-CTERM system associated)